MQKLWIAFGAAMCGLTGCGYSLVTPGADAFPAQYTSLAIPVFENRTPEVHLGLACTRVLQQHLATPTRWVEEDPEKAALLLRGVVASVQERTLAFDGSSPARRVEMEVEVTVRLEALTPSEGVVYSSAPERGLGSYRASGAPADVNVERRAALTRACQEATARLAQELGDSLPNTKTPTASELSVWCGQSKALCKTCAFLARRG